MLEKVNQVISVLPQLLRQSFLLGSHHGRGQWLLLRHRAALVAAVVGENVIQRAAARHRKEIRVARR